MELLKKFILGITMVVILLGGGSGEAEVLPPHLEYFGFYASGANPEVADFSNVYWILAGQWANTPVILDELKSARAQGMKAIVSLSGYFFKPDFNLYSPEEMRQRWEDLAPQLAEFVADGTILLFYPLDEPYNGPKLKKMKMQQMRGILENISSMIRDSFPQTLLGVILGKLGPVPRNYDWISLDRYDCWDDCGGKSFPQLYQEIETSLTSPQQRMFLVPDTWKGTLGKPTENQTQEMIKLFNKFVKLAKNKKRVIGLFNFIYGDLVVYDKNGNIKGHKYGARSIPKLLERVKAVGIEIKNR